MQSKFDKLIPIYYLIAILVLWFLADKEQREPDDFGFRPDPEATARFLSELDKPTFGQAGEEIIREAKGRDTFLWRYADRCHQLTYKKPFGPWRQGIGDCVSFGYAMSAYVAACCDYVNGEIPEAPLMPATEAIYGGARVEQRGIDFAGYSDGATGSGAARWIRGLDNGTGGIIFRKNYERGINLTKYSKETAKVWGAFGCGGRGNTWLDKEANKHTATVAQVRTYEEACAAIEAGAPVAICCNIGWSSTRDKDGYAARSGRWLHCQSCIAVRYAEGPGKRDGILIINSWGDKWNAGPKWPDDQPDGSYWCDKKTFQAVLAQGESFAVSGVNGFHWRDLDHRAWLDERE